MNTELYNAGSFSKGTRPKYSMYGSYFYQNLIHPR